MKILNTLIVEDSEDDTELLLYELRRGGYEPHYRRIETAEGMKAELDRQAWDIVFSDFSMPKFSAFDALAILRESGHDIPFIIVSGTIGEDRAVHAMKAGAHDYILKGSLKRLIPATERELRDAQTRSEQRHSDVIIHRLAYLDQVTELPNRARFYEIADAEIAQANSESRSIALLLMDLDSFKNVNDTLGHARGDALLKQVGARLQRLLPAPHIVARIGGDEFGILLPRLANIDEIQTVIGKIQAQLEPPFMIDDVPISVEASIGVGIMPDHAEDSHALLQVADIAMYRAKHLASGYVLYDPKYNLHSAEKLGLMAELRQAIDQNQLVLYFQPKLALKTGRVVGFEALVRWQHPRLGLLGPNDFILAAEQTGLIGSLTRWVMESALTFIQQAALQDYPLRVSVNLSARSLHDANLLEMINEAISASGTKPELLMLEITETAIVLDPIRAKKTLDALSQRGIKLSIDDFGTGYTSLASIKDLPINEIKIDRSFIKNMLTDNKDFMIIRSIIELGHNLGLTTVAEGIEDKDAMHTLLTLGCDEVQGYFICRPKASDQILLWLSENN